MADSKLLKEAIADAKAVRQTAIENARIALEEAFTPKLQSLVSKKLQAEMEEDDYDDDEEEMEENVDSSKIGKGEGKDDSGTDNKQPSGSTTSSHTDLDPETQKQTAAVGAEDSENEKVDDLKEDEVPDPYDAEYETPEEEKETNVYEEDEFDYEEEDEDELDLESIIRELESELTEDEDEDDYEDDEDDDEVEIDIELDEEDDFDDEDLEDIDLDEILREMGYGDDEEEELDEAEHEDDDDEKYDELEGELEEAYATIRDLKGTINEVNLLNAKLLYTNKLFRSYELDNSQKVKVVESLDRTSNVREVKLVYSTLAESMKFGGKVGKKAKKITEGMASRASNSTAPSNSKEIIKEGNELADRFKKLAGIINK